MAFRIGQKVVCVRSAIEHVRYDIYLPLVGEIYTVRGFDESGGVLFNEIINPVGRVEDVETGDLSYSEPSFYPDRFRPLLERKTDISCFTEILDRENKNCRMPVSDHQSN